MRSRAFTLLELLVVVSIIIALLAILLPSLNRAIGVAQLSVCMSNARQQSIASAGHAGDRFGQFPIAGVITGKSITGGSPDISDMRTFSTGSTSYLAPLPAAMGPYMSMDIRVDSTANLTADLNDPTIMKPLICPAHADVQPMTWLLGSGLGYAPAGVTSYGFNEAFLGYWTGMGRAFGNFKLVTRPSAVMLFAESQQGRPDNMADYYNQTWGVFEQLYESTLWDYTTDQSALGQKWRYPMVPRDRHGGRMSVSFVDGHVSSVEIDSDETDQIGLSMGLNTTQ